MIYPEAPKPKHEVSDVKGEEVSPGKNVVWCSGLQPNLQVKWYSSVSVVAVAAVVVVVVVVVVVAAVVAVLEKNNDIQITKQ